MKQLAALAIGLSLLSGVALAAPATVTDPNGSTQATVNSDKTLNVRALATPQAIISGRQTITTSAVALPSGVYTNGIVLRALSTNSASVCIGPSTITTSNGYCLAPGEAISYGAANTNQLFVIGTAADVIMWTGN